MAEVLLCENQTVKNVVAAHKKKLGFQRNAKRKTHLKGMTLFHKDTHPVKIIEGQTVCSLEKIEWILGPSKLFAFCKLLCCVLERNEDSAARF